MYVELRVEIFIDDDDYDGRIFHNAIDNNCFIYVLRVHNTVSHKTGQHDQTQLHDSVR